MDPLLSSRRAILKALKNNADIIAIVPAARIYPQTAPASPTWPFIKTGAPSDVPITATCVNGSELIIAVHGFAKPRTGTGGVVLETAEDHCSRLAGAIRDALHLRRLPLDEGGYATIRFTNRQLLQDGAEADAYHAVINLRVRCIRG